jgi:hypothetical protein
MRLEISVSTQTPYGVFQVLHNFKMMKLQATDTLDECAASFYGLKVTQKFL